MEFNFFERELFISALEHARILILKSYVVLASINIIEVYGAVVISKSLISIFTHFWVGTSEVSNRNFVGHSTYLKHNTNIIVCEFLFQNVN